MNMQNHENVHSMLPFWPSLSVQQQKQLEARFLYKSYGAGKPIIFSDEKKDGMLIILKGIVRVYMLSGLGREITVLVLRPGDVFNILTADIAREGDIQPQLQSMNDAAIAYIKRAELEQIAYGSRAVAEYILNTSARNAQDILNNISEYLFNPLRANIVSLLLKTSLQQKCDCAAITHETIANHLGTTREVVSREIIYLRKKGLISSGRGKITLLDKDGLLMLAKHAGSP